MYVLDGTPYSSLEEASSKTGIAKSTLEKHINSTWKSKKGLEHTLTEVEDVATPQPAAEDTSYVDPFLHPKKRDPFLFNEEKYIYG